MILTARTSKPTAPVAADLMHLVSGGLSYKVALSALLGYFVGLTQSNWSPTWTAGSAPTPPSLGNGTLTGNRYTLGKINFFKIDLTIGSTTNKGSDGFAWIFSIPVPFVFGNFNAICIDASVSTTRIIGGSGSMAFGAQTTGSVVTNVSVGPTAYNVSALGPFSWATGDVLTLTGWFIAT